MCFSQRYGFHGIYRHVLGDVSKQNSKRNPTATTPHGQGLRLLYDTEHFLTPESYLLQPELDRFVSIVQVPFADGALLALKCVKTLCITPANSLSPLSELTSCLASPQ